MSQMHTYSMTCPECGHIQKVDVWSALNISRNPELHDKLFEAAINVFRCETCDHKALINVPLLYHDMRRQYCIQYYPRELLDNDDFLSQFTRDGKMDLSAVPINPEAEKHYLIKPHIVFSLNEMIYYIEFRDKVFDQNE
ncbi:MAG: CpXC domain-containing protein [Chloroflexota bacterium]